MFEAPTELDEFRPDPTGSGLVCHANIRDGQDRMSPASEP